MQHVSRGCQRTAWSRLRGTYTLAQVGQMSKAADLPIRLQTVEACACLALQLTCFGA